MNGLLNDTTDMHEKQWKTAGDTAQQYKIQYKNRVSHKSLKQLNANLRNCSYAVTV